MVQSSLVVLYLIVHPESSGLFVLLLLLESILPVLEILLHLPADRIVLVRSLLCLHFNIKQVVEGSSCGWVEKKIVCLRQLMEDLGYDNNKR